ncbi:non-ribosomal peptide synthetase [Amycolatopsis sp. CA-230715]|uniref:non-ribosomal peptide synthetase n=1 Tax=Amycolatopsis sp. CA-230715 TaxID=2745196 RepID=UPI001C010D90|nr:non-ribosomal peptide synthetase [Amycolatopsis sp. CA-230715]
MTSTSPDLIRRIRALSGSQRRALITLLTRQGVDLSALSTLDTIPAVPRSADEPVPLSFTQQRLWFLAQLDGPSAAYNIPMGLRLRGRLDRTALVRALEAMVQRHEVLRTRFLDREGVPYQYIGDGRNFAVGFDDVESATVFPICEQEAAAAFDLANDSLIRARLLRVSEREHVLLVTAHHSVADGRSVGVFFRDLTALYEAFCAGRPSPLEPLPIQYADYAHWQRGWLADDVQARQVEYWRKQLEGVDPRLSLPADRERPAVKTYRGAREGFRCPAELLAKLRSVSERYEVTLYMTLLAAYAVVLNRYTCRTDVAVGTVVANRNRLELEDLVGFFANTLVMRADLSGDPTFPDLLAQVKRTALDAYDHQDVSFEAVVDALRLERSLAYSPVFQTMLVLHEARTQREIMLGDLEVSEVEIDTGYTKFDCTVELRETPDGLEGLVEYNTDLFDRDTIRRLAGHYTELLASIAADPRARISRLGMVDAAERQQVLAAWNETNRPYSADRCLHQLFEDVVARHPDRIALVDGDRVWTYAELNAWANRIGHTLRDHGVGPDTLVGLCTSRSAEMIAGIYGALKAGGAYMPIEPSYPPARISELVETSGVGVILVQSHVDTEPLAAAKHVLTLDHDGLAQRENNLPAGDLEPHHLAYVIHTSGSTGRPKGVMIEHRAAVNRIEWMQSEYQLTENDVVLQKTPFSFDVSVWEFFWPLLSGARLVVAEADGHKDPGYLVSAIQRFGVTTLHFVPSMLRAIVGEAGWSACVSVRQVFCSGEALPRDLCERHYALHTAPLHNLYGPTEAAVDVSHWTCPSDPPHIIPIGRPIQNTRLYVLNDAMAPQGIGCVGELYIAGVGLARGYLHQPELTRERFVPDPFEPGARIYRTGDLARWRPDGTLEFLGRVDDQIKLRGHRIELGEIEHRLGEQPAVRSCVVVVREDQPGNQRLVAYVVSDQASAGRDIRGDLVRHLVQALPDYMVPSAFVTLDALPVTASGKLDRAALPAPDLSAFAQRTYIAPRTPTERLLASLWAELLGFDADRVSTEDNFFALGGHSLNITVLVARLSAAGMVARVRDVFSAPTLAALAERIDHGQDATNYAVPPNAIPDGCERITPDMLPLVELTQEQIDAIIGTVPSGAPNVQDIYPLVPAQEGILFHHLVAPDHDPYLLSALFVAENEAACARFTDAVRAVIDRNDVLRTAVLTAGLPAPVQVVYRAAPLTVRRTSLDPHRDAEEQAHAMLADPAPMAVDQAPMFRLTTAEDPNSGRYYVLLDFHHLVEDATSLQLIMEEIAVHLAGRADLLPVVAPYRDFVAHTLHQIASGDAESYFGNVLSDITEPTMPFGLTDVRGDGRRKRKLRRSLPSDLTEAVRAEAQRLHISPACLFHTACAMVVAAGSGRDDVVFGTVMSGRLQGVPGVERMLGNFINTLPLRVRLSGRTVRALIADVEAGLQELIAREQSSLSAAQRGTGLDSDTPLFSAAVNFRHFEHGHDAEAHRIDDSGVRWLELVDNINYPMGISLDDLGSELSLIVQVEDTIEPEALLAYVETALAGIVGALTTDDGNGTAALDVDVLPAAERRRLLVEWNDTAGPYPHDSCLFELFEAQVARRPDEVAVRHGDRRLTYAELNARANEIAHRLHDRAVGPDVLVGLCADRSPELVIGLLGILKAGGACVPIDPGYPDERIRGIVRGSGIGILLSQASFPSTQFDGVDEIVYLDTGERARDGLPVLADLRQDNLSRAESGVTPEHLAYAVFTSGSTGRPKGVLVPQRGVVRLLCSPGYFSASDDTVMLHYSSISFDAGVQEVLTPLVAGGQLVLHDGDSRDVGQMLDCVERTGVTMMVLSAAFLPAFAEEAEGRQLALKCLAVVGEAFSARDVRRVVAAQPDVTVVNGYGPTENSIGSTYQVIPPDVAEDARIPIGRPLPHSTAYVTDSRLRLVPTGVVGELCMGGAGVARGYLGDPELTAERFVADPFGTEPGGRLYRTGDLVRRLPDGALEFVGRLDDQVKVRGFRVEPGEIEAALRAHAMVHSAAVTPHATGETRSLVAYVRPTEQWLDAAAQEQNADHLEQWQRVFEDQYAGSDATDDGVDLASWQSSYTREEIPEPEMLEWIDGTVERIAELQPKRLLEVGVGTGLLLFRYAESCAAVCAIDTSAGAVDEVRRGVERRNWSHVTVAHGDALAVRELAGSTFDTIVLNSVAQYFPNRLYLEQVIAQLLPLVEDGGRIFVGDVRNLDLFSAHVGAVERSRASSRITVGALTARVQRRRQQDAELLISPTWFAALPERFPELGSVDLMVKRGVGDNEMLAYRYDAVLTKGPARSGEPLTWLTASGAAELRDLLDSGEVPSRFGVTGLTNPRIADDVRVAEGLTRWASTRRVEPLPNGVRMTAEALAEARELETTLQYAERLDYRVAATWSQDRPDGLDLVFGRHELPLVRARAPYHRAALTNSPQLGRMGWSMSRTLKEYLSARLPDYMVPGAYVILEELPVTRNGKVDKRALPLPDEQDVTKEVYSAPRTATERTLCRLVEGVLGLSQVGLQDNFFDLGGHSLLATRVTIRVRKELGVDLPLQLILAGTSVADMATALDDALAADAKSAGSPEVPLVTPTPVRPGEEVPLALQQRDLWFLDESPRFGPAPDNVQLVFQMVGPLDCDAWANAVRAVIDRHAVLRTSYLRRDGIVFQTVNDGVDIDVPVQRLGESADEDTIAESLRAERARPFAPDDRVQLRVHLLALSDNEHWAVFTRPWGVVDGWSAGILLTELSACYRALSQGGKPDLPALPLQYADFARWQGHAVDQAELDRQLSYWRTRLAGLPECLSLRTDHPRPEVKSYQGSSVELRFPGDLPDRLKQLSQDRGATLYMTLLSAFAVLLGGRCADREVAIGSPVTNRPRIELEQLIGYFVNRLVIRLDVAPEQTFTELLARTRVVTAEAHEHKDLPFRDLVEDLVPVSDPGCSPLFQVMFNLISAGDGGADGGAIDDLDVRAVPNDSGTSAFDLNLMVRETDVELTGYLEYSTDLFTQGTAEAMARDYERLLWAIVADPDADLAGLRARAEESPSGGGVG